MLPSPSIWMIRLSLIYLLLAVTAGGLLMIHKAIDLHSALWILLPVHFELAIWGWLIQFVIGTAYWMFPKFLTGTRRGPEWIAWIVLIVYNTGLLLLVNSSFVDSTFQFDITGRTVIAVSLLIFVTLTWNRVVSYRKNH